jgi:hypothetical protein
MTGKDMLEFIPLDQGVDTREPELVHCFGEAVVGDWVTLEPRDWFHDVHTQNGNFLWCPAPAVADVALKQLCKTHHTSPWNAHIFFCPALMTSRWQKHLSKVADVMFTVPVGSMLWGAHMHEPVVVTLICPLLQYRPWQVLNTNIVAELRNQVSGVWSPCLTWEQIGLR